MVPPAVEAMPALTVRGTDTDIPHHMVGTPRDSDTDETMSIGQISGDGVVAVGTSFQSTAMKPSVLQAKQRHPRSRWFRFQLQTSIPPASCVRR